MPLPQFEFDERKSRLNKLKHGIDFVEAQALWLDEALREVRVGSAGEPRFLMIGRIDGRHWTAVVTYRGASVQADLSAEVARKGGRGTMKAE